MRALLTVVALCVLTPLAPASHADPLGVRPSYSERALSRVANSRAIDRRIWAPGIDDGFVPQGVTFAGGALYLASYQSRSKSRSRGPCRLYRIDPDSGKTMGTLDLPDTCGHAGGVARGPSGTLLVADTRVVFIVKLEGKAKGGIGRVVRSIRLEGDVRGSFAAGNGPFVWLGTYRKDATGKIYKFRIKALPDVIDETMAVRSLELPRRSQGAAFDAKGRLWVSQSSGKFGTIARLDLKDGRIVESFSTAIGVEDLSFDPAGRLWTVSEAGSIRWSKWRQYFPVLYRLDVRKLK